MTLENLIIIPNSDDGNEFAAPVFQASSTLNQPGNSGKY